MGLETATLLAISAATSAVGTGLSVMSSFQQSKAAAAQAEYQAAVERNNAIIARQDAAAIRERGEVQEQDHRRRIAQAIGQARASQAANGFLVDGDMDSTNVDLVADLAEAGELDILRMRDDTELQARNREIAAINNTAQAGLFSLQASSQNAGAAAFGTLLEGASRTAGILAKA